MDKMESGSYCFRNSMAFICEIDISANTNSNLLIEQKAGATSNMDMTHIVATSLIETFCMCSILYVFFHLRGHMVFIQ